MNVGNMKKGSVNTLLMDRAYEYLDLDWYLPFWHSDFVKFWTTVPLKYRYKQTLRSYYVNGIIIKIYLRNLTNLLLHLQVIKKIL